MCSNSGSPREALATVAQAAAALATAPAGEVDFDADRLKALRRAIDQLEAVFTTALVAFEDTGRHRADGARDATAWARTELRMTGGAAKQRLATGRSLREHLPVVAQAFEAGQLSLSHAAELARAVDRDPTARRLLTLAQGELLELAQEVEPVTMRRAVEAWVRDVDPELDARHARELFAARQLYLSPRPSGAVEVSGQLDPVGGEALLVLLEAVGSGLRTAQDTRTPAQLRADALVHLAQAGLATGPGADAGTGTAAGIRVPDTGGTRPQVTLTISLAELRAKLGGDLGRCGRVGADTAARIMCDADLQTALLADDGRTPLDLGRTRRFPDARLRKAVILRDGVCQFAGCDIPATWGEIHHTTPWTAGGRTNLDELVLVCVRHHHDVHEGGRRIVRNRDGTCTTYRPDGSAIDPGPPTDRQLRQRSPLGRRGRAPTPATHEGSTARRHRQDARLPLPTTGDGGARSGEDAA